MNCTNCGAPIQASERFCTKCGAPNTARQPSREEIRARVQGGGRHAAAPAAGRRAAPVPGAPAGGAATLFCLIACVLSLLQVLYLFLNSIIISFMGESEGGSLFTVLRAADRGFLAAFMILLNLVLLLSIVLPMILRGRPMPLITAAVSAVSLLLFIICFVAIRKYVSDAFFGIKPRLGLVGWLYILNGVAIPVLVFLAGRNAGPAPVMAAAPARAPAPRQVSSRPQSPLRQPPMRRGVNGPVRPAAPAQNVTPPDTETIAALRRMAQMHQQGLVSDEEFARIKAECVARGWIRG